LNEAGDCADELSNITQVFSRRPFFRRSITQVALGIKKVAHFRQLVVVYTARHFVCVPFLLL
jgi:hypothetical protein